MNKISMEELEVLMSYFEKMGEDISKFIKLEKITDGLYRGETETDYYFGDTKRVEIKFFNNNNCCAIERISRDTLENENKSGNMEENITVEIKSDIFVKENDNVIWTSYRGDEVFTSNDIVYSGYATHDINNDDYIAFKTDGYPRSHIDPKHITISSQEVKVAKLNAETLFTDISDCDFKSLTNSNTAVNEKSSKKLCNI